MQLEIMEKIFPQFEPTMGTSGRWFVSVQTGKGPNSTSETSKRNQRRNAGFRPKRNTGPANRTRQRDATRRGGAADLLASFGPMSRGWDSVGGSS